MPFSLAAAFILIDQSFLKSLFFAIYGQISYSDSYMKYIFSDHAKFRMKERGITAKLVRNAVAKPTKMLYDKKDRILFKKLYKKAGAMRLLMVVGELNKNLLRVITVIDTSKIRKYL